MATLRIVAVGVLLAGLIPIGLWKGRPAALVEDGQSDYTIVVGKESAPAEQHAAREFQHFIKEISGVELPIRTDEEKVRGRLVCIGPSRYVKKTVGRIKTADLGLEGYAIRATRRGLAIVGGGERGTLYGVYSFLEDELDCRWFTPDCSRIPKRPALALRKLDRRYAPPLEYRSTDYPNARDPDWCARNKLNGHHHDTGPERGGHIRYGPFVHTFDALIPPNEYFDQHPEYFSLQKGKRLKERTQLCLTNPDVLRLGKAQLRAWIKQQPDATIFSVSQNDWHNWCECETCAAVAEREGSQIGPILEFCNALADDIRADYPDKAVDTLAYTYSRKPPKSLRPRPNVIVRLCSIECCFVHTLADDDYNASFRDDIVGWSEKCNRLYVWDYVINYAHSIMPFPNLFALQPNINFFIRHGVKGIYEEACYFTKGAELAELRTYILAKTLWDPTYDTNQAIDEFIAAYYGEAATYLRLYIDLMHRAAQDAGEHVRIYSPPQVKYLEPDVLEQAQWHFDRAETAVAGDETLVHRVRVARMPVLYARIMRAVAPTVAADNLPREKMVSLIDQFEQTARKEGVTRVREGGPLAPLDAWLQHVRDKAAQRPSAAAQSQ